jgi:hypothetical protein
MVAMRASVAIENPSITEPGLSISVELTTQNLARLHMCQNVSCRRNSWH